MKNAIKADKISKEIIDLISKNKKIIDYVDYPETNDFILNNKYYNQFKDNIYNEDKYPDLENLNIKAEVDLLRNELRCMRRTKQIKPRKMYIVTCAIVATILYITFTLNNIEPIDQYLHREETYSVLANINTEAIIKLSDGSKIKVNEIGGSIRTKNIVTKSNNKSISYNIGNNSINSDKIGHNTAMTPSMRTLKIELSDGTIVTLNANSVLIYPTKFKDGNRVVELKGEAYFNVKKSSKPFIVETNNLSINVYGTEFNVNTSDNAKIETVLVNGSIGIKDKKGEIILIEPNQSHIYNIHEKKHIVNDVNIANYTCWLENEFNYENISIINLLNKVSMWYGINFTIKDDISKIKVNIWANRDDSIMSMLSGIERSTDILFIRESQNKFNVKLKNKPMM